MRRRLWDCSNLTQKASGNVLLANYGYTLYANGRRSGATEQLLHVDDATYGTNTIGWKYDGMNRLTNETYSTTLSGISFTTGYGYDKVGNRLSEVVNKPTVTNTVTYGYNGNDQLTNEVSTLNGSTKYLYDANGSLTSKTNATANTGYTFNYDLQNRLQGATVTGVSGGPITTSYLYNDQGIRVRSIANGTTKYFLNDANNPTGYSQVQEELSAVNGTPSMSYVLGDDVLAQATSSGVAAYLRHDGHGSTRQLSQMGNIVVEQYNYDAYGQSLGTQSTFASPYVTSMLYAGQQFDPALQQYYMRARYYDASNGRFSQLDPLTGNNEDPQSLHKYAYADADPVNGWDPSGQQELAEQLLVTAIRSVLFVFNGISLIKNVQRSGLAAIRAYEAFQQGDTYSGFGYSVEAIVNGGLAALNAIGLKSFLQAPPTITGGPLLGGNGAAAIYWQQIVLSNPAVRYWIGRELIPAILGSGIVNFSMVSGDSGGGDDSGGVSDGGQPGEDSGQNPQVIQTGGNTVLSRTAKLLGMTKQQAKLAMEQLKQYHGLPNDFHQTKILSNGDVLNSATDKVIDNLWGFVD